MRLNEIEMMVLTDVRRVSIRRVALPWNRVQARVGDLLRDGAEGGPQPRPENGAEQWTLCRASGRMYFGRW